MRRMLLRYFVMVCMFFTFIWAGGKGINGKYIHRAAGDESLFYVLSQKMPVCGCSEIKNKPIAYDYTYVQSTDSVSMLISLPLRQTVRDLKVEITDGVGAYAFVPEIIFVEPKGADFEYRLRVVMSFETFEKLYRSTNPFVITFYYVLSGNQYRLKYCYGDKKWNESKTMMNQIIDLIKVNSNKR